MEQEVKEVKQLITKDMTIGDVVAKYPACIEVLQSAGVHCVGCHVSYHETLEQGFKGHGMSDEEVDMVISKLNAAVEESKLEEGKELVITNKAAEKLKEVLKENNKEGFGLRVEIIPGGCSGFQYGLELDHDATDLDLTFEEKGVKIIVSKENMQFLKGAKLDYVDSLQGGGFKISNPNAHSSCGCGQSFEY
ncbi:iron-sulfur cluster assembly accessory protein [Candidatus Woesearchaeota archaeon]|nr:iron-sulfur cluster assembly accessory protein [Candidatus Woesearchaeota archaeon]